MEKWFGSKFQGTERPRLTSSEGGGRSSKRTVVAWGSDIFKGLLGEVGKVG